MSAFEHLWRLRLEDLDRRTRASCEVRPEVVDVAGREVLVAVVADELDRRVAVLLHVKE